MTYTDRIILKGEVFAREFAAYDTKGRRFGTRAYVEHTEYKLRDNEGHSGWFGYRVAPGIYWEYTPQTTRGGRSYGAIQRANRFNTEAECLAAVERYFAQAEKRALKNKARAS